MFAELLEKIANEIAELEHVNDRTVLYVLRKHLFPYPDTPSDNFLHNINDFDVPQQPMTRIN